MKRIIFNCPACGQELEAQADMAGEKIDCPSCKREVTVGLRKEHGFGAGLIIAVLGFGIWAFARFGQSGVAADEIQAAVIGGAALAGGGIGICLWRARDHLIESGGLIFMVCGLAALAACLLSGFIPGLIAAGFLAVVGAVLTLRK